jgi:DNA-binding MarR family transcriptional regulator
MNNLQKIAADAFWEAFPPFWQSVRLYIRQAAAEQYGITFEQFHILRHIQKGQSSVKELAQVKQISRPAISQAVDAIAAKGLVERTPDLQDRRSVRLVLTPEGERLLEGIFSQAHAWMVERFSALTDEELHDLTRGLQALKKVQDG